jgi:HSP20 family molecular chaperone IbpA
LSQSNSFSFFLFFFLQSSSLPRAYIGAHRNRHYINNNSTSSLLSTDYFSSTTPSSKSFQPIQSEQKNNLSNAETADALQTQQEERAPVKYFSSTTPLDERQLNLQQEQKAKGFLSSSPSSSLFFFPTTHNTTPLSDYDHSLASFEQQQQHFHHPPLHYEQHSYKQPLNSEDKNNQFLLFNQFKQQKQKQLSTDNQNFVQSDLSKENSSLSSTFSFSDTIAKHNDNDNQSHLLTSTPILSSLSSYYRTTNNDISASLSTKKNNSNKPLPLILDSINDQSSTISTVGLITDLQHKADVCQLNNMSSSSSSLRYSSNLGTGTITTHPYDQRISDQGNKYIIQLKTDEYQENEFTITPRYSLNQLIIDAKHREEDSIGGYIHRELHKIFNIPKHIDLNRHKYSYNKHAQELTIEIPYLQSSLITNENQNDQSFISPIRNTTEPLTYSSGLLNQNSGGNILPTINRSNYFNDSNNTSGIGTTTTDSTLMRSSNTAVAPTYESSFGKTKPFDFDLFHRSAFRPQIVHTTSNDNTNTDKKLLMSLDLSDYQAEDIKVSIKDRELIVKAERKIETDTRKSRTSFFQSTSLPPQTDIEHLQSNYINGKLIIEAPYLEKNNTDRKIKATSTQNQGGINW